MRDKPRVGKSKHGCISPRRRPQGGPRNAALLVISFTTIDCDAAKGIESGRIEEDGPLHCYISIYTSQDRESMYVFRFDRNLTVWLGVGCESEIDHGLRSRARRILRATLASLRSFPLTMTDEYPLMGPKVHECLLSLNVDYAVLRPSWFFENFLTVHLATIKEKNTIISASADGKIGFISADDIADVAVSALTDEKSHNTDHIITGPELLTYDDVADIFTEVLGRKITHTRIAVEQLKERYISFGLPEGFSGMLSSLEGLNTKGVEEEIFRAQKKVTGKRTLKSFVEANRARF